MSHKGGKKRGDSGIERTFVAHLGHEILDVRSRKTTKGVEAQRSVLRHTCFTELQEEHERLSL